MEIDKVLIISNFEEHLKYRLKESSVKMYIHCIKTFIKEGYDFNKPFSYTDFLEKHTIKKRSFVYYNILLRFVDFYCKDNKELRKEIKTAIKLIGKKEKDPIRKSMVISEEAQFEIIKKIKKPKHQLIAWIQKETGARAGDVIRLKKDSLKFGAYTNANELYKVLDITFIKKGDKVQKIPIFNERLMEYIKIRLREIGDEEYVFIDRDVVNDYNREDVLALETRNYKLYWMDLRQACESLGYESQNFSTHDWRRNFAEDVWNNVLDKKDIIALQNALGHSKIDTTVRYLRNSGLQSRDIFKKRYTK